MQFPGQGYILNGAGYPPPPPQQPEGYLQAYPPQQQQGYPPPPQSYQGYPPPPPPSQPPPYQGYPPLTYNSHPAPPTPSTPSTYPLPLPANHPYGSNHNSQLPPLPSRNLVPPPPAPPRPSQQDPPFSPNDPTVGQANYHQPPHSIYNPSPAPVPHLPPPPNVNPNDFVLHVHPEFRNMPPPQFQLSNCQGRKRALLIGINYFNTRNELRGCINDVYNLKHFLITLYNFREEDMVVLTDDQMDPRHIPTKQNMIQAMQWLVRDSRPNDSFFFHFSGHGGRMRDYDGDEDDGYDETIYPVDHEVYGQIVDDMMNDIMVRPLAPGCRLTAIFDSCHSGTALDLPYVYSTQGAVKESSLFKETGSSLMNAGLAYMSGNPMKAVSSMMSIGSSIMNGGSKKKRDRMKQQKGSAADVIMLSGCKDNQTSADAQEAGRATGAMSWALTTALRQNRNQSYLQLLNSIRQLLRQKYQQRPQLSSSHPMDMNLLFMI